MVAYLRALQILFFLFFITPAQIVVAQDKGGTPNIEPSTSTLTPDTGVAVGGSSTEVQKDNTGEQKPGMDNLTTEKIGTADIGTEEGGAGNTDEEEDDFGDDLEDEFKEAEKNSVYDPLEGYNRFMTGVNDSIYVYALDPITGAYRSAIPKGGRRSIGNFFYNLLYPVRLVSNLLQAKFKNSGTETFRFLINSTVGLLGFFDPASAWFGLERKNEDLGQALGFWGVGSGPHIVLPVLGPSNLRDIVGSYPEPMADVIYRIRPAEKSFAIIGFRKINSYSLENMTYTDIRKGTLDLYLFLRDAYEQNRNKKIKE
jgi:phospholipid-binding lipoprotein MlaA